MEFLSGVFGDDPDVPGRRTLDYIRALPRARTSIDDPEAICVAGGALRRVFGFASENSRFDIDIFFISQAHRKRLPMVLQIGDSLRERFASVRREQRDRNGDLNDFLCTNVALTPPWVVRPRSVDVVFQTIADRHFKDVEMLLGDFDFTACCAATDGYRWIAHKDFFDHNRAQRLVAVEREERPAPSARQFARAAKYGGVYSMEPDIALFGSLFFVSDADAAGKLSEMHASSVNWTSAW